MHFHKDEAIFLTFVVIVVFMTLFLVNSSTVSATKYENMTVKHIPSKTIESPISKLKGNPNVVPSVGNVLNRDKAWNDTPTIGMLGGIHGTLAPSVDNSKGSSSSSPGGLPVTQDNYCAVPTGFLGMVVKAWESGKRDGLVLVDGVKIDLGHPGGNAFYDTDGSGCCDTYCRRVVKGGFWSCISPTTVNTQYEARKPTGRPCSYYGRSSSDKLQPLYP